MSKPQRRKGNAKNASSSAAHLYLSEGGASFVGLTPEMNIFQMAESTPEAHSHVDDEVRILLRKLTKKDPSTREKGLRELITFMGSNEGAAESCYEHFTGVVDQLATDGSPTVRLLTMKIISFFIGKLKKGAAKGLRKILPIVLFELCDASNSVCFNADAVLKEHFADDKRQQVYEVFGPIAIGICVELIAGKHNLILPTKYDEEESVDQRKYRLEVQALTSIQKIANLLDSKKELWEEKTANLFENQDLVKKVLNGSNSNLRIALISVCLKLSNHDDIILNGPILQWLMNSLDSEDGAVSDVAWNALVSLTTSEKFFEKVSITKTTIPRILNVIRKKKGHWSRIGPHLLPLVASLFENLKSEGIEVKSLSSIIDSFLDNMPFETTLPNSCAQQWIIAFAEVVQWILSQQGISRDVLNSIIPVTVKVANEAINSKDPENEKKSAELIRWMLEKKAINSYESMRLCELLGAWISEDKDRCQGFCEFLLDPALFIDLCQIHSSLLLKNNPPFFLIRSLVNSENVYFKDVVERINNVGFINDTSKWSKFEAVQIVEFLIRMISLGFEKKIKLSILNDHFGRTLFLKAHSVPKIWDIFFENWDKEIAQEMMKSWKTEGDGGAVAIASDLLREKNIGVDTDFVSEDIGFISSLLESSKNISPEEKRELCSKAVRLVFMTIPTPSQKNYEIIAKKISEIDNFSIEKFFEGVLSSSEFNFSSKRIHEMATRFDALVAEIDENQREAFLGRFLISKKDVEELLGEIEFLEIEALISSSNAVLPSTSKANVERKTMNEEELKTRLDTLCQLVLFNFATIHKNSAVPAFGSIVTTISKYYEQRFLFSELSNETKAYLDEISTYLKSSSGFDVLQEVLNLKRSPIIMDALGYEDVRGPDAELYMDLIHRFSRLSRIEFLEEMHNSFKNGENTEFFQVLQGNHVSTVTNFLIAKAFLSVSSEIFGMENLELVEFLLCGLVTVFDSLDSVIMDEKSLKIKEDLDIEGFVAVYLQIFANVSQEFNRRFDGSRMEDEGEAEGLLGEWKEVYFPTVSVYLFSWFGLVKIDSQPTPFVRSLYEALTEVSEYPEEKVIKSVNTFVPELDAFDYSVSDQSIISHAFSIIDSDVHHVQLIGLQMAKLLAPVMLKKENEKMLASYLKKDEEVTVNKKEKKIEVPIIIRKRLDELMETGRWSVVMLFDAALTCFEMNELKKENEVRVAYCDALAPLIKPCLTTLVLKQPFDIPRSQVNEYYLDTSNPISINFYNKYATRMLYRTLSTMPAAVRLYYKSVPTNATSMVKEVIIQHASRLLIDSELEKVRKSKYTTAKEGELKIRAIPMAGEIVAEYVVEETKMKLTISLPPDFPLSVPTLHLDKDIMKTNHQSRQYLVQLNAFLFHQNGAIVDGIEMWRENVDRGVEGAEACTICMMTIHSSSHQLPKVKCKQCKNKFHSNCLYKWFESSNQSSCPLCRANFT